MKKVMLILMATAMLITCCTTSSGGDRKTNPPGTYLPGIPAQTLQEFEEILETIRISLNIPGMSAGILKNGDLVWWKGFGYADKEIGIRVQQETKFHLASLTKPFGAVVVMLLVEEGRLGLDDLIADFGISLPNSDQITVRHLLTHTSEGVPGTRFKYNGSRYALLGDIIAACSGRSFCKELKERITIPFGLMKTAPNPYLIPNCFFDEPGDADLFASEMAQGYNPSGTIPFEEPHYFSPAAGLASSVSDLAYFSRLLDGTALLSMESRVEMFSTSILEDGGSSGSGLGWLIDFPEEVKVCWIYGSWNAHSGLFLKVPEQGLDFVILANSNMLSRASEGIGSDGDVMRSIVGAEFLNAFVFGTAELPD